MTPEPATAESASPLRDEKIYRLIKADWVVVNAAVRTDTWIRSSMEYCPDASYSVFPYDAAARTTLERGLGAAGGNLSGGHLTLDAKPLGPAAGAAVETLDGLRDAGRFRHIQYLRIEASNAALDILLGAKTLLRHSRIDVIEIASDPDEQSEGLAPLAFFLARYDYTVMRLAGNEFKALTQADLATSRWTGNTLAIHARMLMHITEVDQDILDLPALLGRHGIAARGIIHLGAHEGEELPTYLKLGAKRVLLVEANPLLAARLRSRAKTVPEVTVAHCAVNDVDGPVSLHVLSKDESSSILPLKLHQKIYPHVVENEVIEVPGLRLDRLMESLALDAGEFNVMCLDVQGAELRALRSATKTLEAIDAISVEINFVEMFADCAQVEDIDDYLGERGFDRVATLTPYHLSWGDALYVRRQRRLQ